MSAQPKEKQTKPRKSSEMWKSFYEDFTHLHSLRHDHGVNFAVSGFADKYKDIPKIPKTVIKKLLNYQNDPNSKRSNEIASWVFNSEKPTDDTLKALELIFSRGVSPCAFMENMGASILGLAAYTARLDVVKLAYKYAAVEDCRLVLHPEHTHDANYYGSTLLHRLLERKGDSDVIDLILEKDPLSVAQKMHNGKYPEDCARDPEDRNRIRTLRIEMDHKTLTEGIVGDKVFPEGKSLKM